MYKYENVKKPHLRKLLIEREILISKHFGKMSFFDVEERFNKLNRIIKEYGK